MYRKDELEIPIAALRECCANSLTHMDWRKTASVGVAIYDERSDSAPSRKRQVELAEYELAEHEG